jgi:C_GCAxxG_C_C family probable redox protein
MNKQACIQKARQTFITEENVYGCAETTFMVLKEAFGLPDPGDSSVAMVLNGGVAYSGGICGALSGAAMAVGMLAEQRIADHKQAKRTARRIIARYMQDFQSDFDSLDCRELIGLDISKEADHHEFIESGIWKITCMGQIEYAIEKLFRLRELPVWQQTVEQVNR